MLTVRERIRIGGEKVSETAFAKKYWEIFDRLKVRQLSCDLVRRFELLRICREETFLLQEHNLDMPFYFQYLTLMAFELFVDEQVDVAIVETGLGAYADCTNVIQCVVVRTLLCK